jgi:hypothetical protein
VGAVSSDIADYGYSSAVVQLNASRRQHTHFVIMILLHWIAFGIGLQMLVVLVALAVGGGAFWLHYRCVEERSRTAFLLPCFLTLAVGVWFTGKGLVTTSYLDFSSTDRILASLEQHRTTINSVSLRFAMLPALLFTAVAFAFLALKRASFQWILALGLFAGISLYLGFLDSYLTQQTNAKVSPSPAPARPMQPATIPSDWRTYQFREHRLSIAAPTDWKADELEPGMIWHVGTDTEPLISVSVKVNTDWSMGAMGNDKYLESITKDGFLKMISVLYSKSEINYWETDYPFAGSRALHAIYSGYIGDTKITVLVIQTIQRGKLYTLNCQTLSPSFHTLYSRTFLRVADTMRFD